MKAWRRRFFWNVGSSLFYGEGQGEISLGSIELASCLAVDFVTGTSASAAGATRFNVVTPDRTYSLSAVSHEMAETWVMALNTLMLQARPRSSPLNMSFDLSSPAGEETSSSPNSSLAGSLRNLALPEELLTAIAERDAKIEHLRSKMSEKEACYARDVAQLNDKLSHEQLVAAGLLKQTDLIALMKDPEKSMDDKARVLFSAIKDRDAQVHSMSQKDDVQMKRIQTLERQVAEMTKSMNAMRKENETLSAAARIGSSANKRNSLAKVRLEDSPVGGGGMGSPSIRRHRRNSSVGSPVSPFAETPVAGSKNAKEGLSTPLPTSSNRPQSALVAGSASGTKLSERRLASGRRANSMLLPTRESTPLGTPTSSATLTGEKKLVTPPPWQLRKMMENVEQRSPLPAIGESASLGTPGGPKMLGLKSHSEVALLPGTPVSAPLPRTSNAGREEMEKGTTGSPRRSQGIKSGSAESPVAEIESFRKEEKNVAQSLHELGLPTQGLLRLPKKQNAMTDDPVVGESLEATAVAHRSSEDASDGTTPDAEGSARHVLASSMGARSHLGGGADAARMEPVRRTMSRSADDWAQAAAKARAAVVASQASSSNGGHTVVMSSDDHDHIHMTPSFEGLAEKIGELQSPSPSLGAAAGGHSSNVLMHPPHGSSMKRRPSTPSAPALVPSGHASRFQEELLDQMRAEQFELMKTIKDMKDDAEVMDMRMAQLMDRIRNGEEIIDDKTGECEQQKIIIRELRKESGLLRARLESLELIQSRSSSSGEAILPAGAPGVTSSGVKRLYFGEPGTADAADAADDSPATSTGTTPNNYESPSKQFLLSEDENSGDEGAFPTRQRKAIADHAKVVSKLEDELKKESIYRQSVEKQV